MANNMSQSSSSATPTNTNSPSTQFSFVSGFASYTHPDFSSSSMSTMPSKSTISHALHTLHTHVSRQFSTTTPTPTPTHTPYHAFHTKVPRHLSTISFFINNIYIKTNKTITFPLPACACACVRGGEVKCVDARSFSNHTPEALPDAWPCPGFDAYLVGGCVRDLILKRTPKDFDVLTTAELKEVTKTFSWCEIVGKRFPICHVHVGDDIVEVSSFSTSARNHHSMESSIDFQRHDECDEKDLIRWRNCLQRDLTINGLMFDPYSNTIYDYIGGMEDIKKAKVRTVSPTSFSLVEDCARILRAIRIAARLGFGFSKETAHGIKHLAHSVLLLDKWRQLMEINYMLAYGSAEPSLRLLWRFGLLELLLPIQAAYFVRDGFRRRDKKTNMLLSLFSNMDKLLAPDRPCHSSLWVAILAFHMAFLDKPRDPVVVAAFSLAVYNGGDMVEAVEIARKISKPHATIYQELSDHKNLDGKLLKKEVLDLGVSVSKALSNMTDAYYVSRAMRNYPKAPYSDLVIIPLHLYLKAMKVFECVNQGKEVRFVPKQGRKIDYESLAMGSLQEVRHVFARVVFDTVYPLELD